MTSASSRFKSTIVALAALALGAASCGSTNACKSGTLLVTLTFDSATAAATQLVVDVSSPGASSRQHQLDHQAGMTTGTIEIDFPDGYTAGQTVQVTVTASSSGGAAIGSATGSVTLASGCSTLTLHFGGSDAGGPTGTGGASGGAGGKSPSGTGGANAGGAGGAGGAAGSIGGTGTGGTGTGGTGTGGIGTGTGGTGTGGAGGAACVFTSAEDCFNGIDDDCNGKTDCEDPACTPTTECVAAPGTTFQAGVEAATTSTTCPSNFTGGETALNEGLNVPAAASCTGCSCTASTSCSISLYSYASVAACTADTGKTGGTLVGQALSSSVMCVAPSGTALTAPNGYRVSNLTQSDSACTASGTPALPATSWTTQKKFCAANRLGGGCSPGYVCAPKLAQLADHCVRADGNLACPAGYSPETDTWYKGMSDSRACAACGCGTQTPGDCTKESLSGTPYARNLAFWPTSYGLCPTNGGTSSTISTTPGSQTCCALQCAASGCGATGTACGNFGYAYPPVQASCPPTSAISGAAAPTGPETVCCL
jgi:hypothetical protein